MSDVVLNNRGESMLVLPDFVVNMDRVVCAHMNHGDEKERWPWALNIVIAGGSLHVQVSDTVFQAYTAWLRGEDFADE